MEQKLKEWQKVEFSFEKKMFKGIVMPSSDKEILRIKMASGYNAGFDMKKVSGLKVLKGTQEVSKMKSKSVLEKEDLPLISVLHTGGTIASRVDYKTGAVTANFEEGDFLTMFPKLGEIANYNHVIIGNILSENIRFKHHSLIAEKTFKELNNEKVKGVIIGHGTDTLHFTSAALSFMIENPSKAVILVGSQRSSDRPSSDASSNLEAASKFIVETNFRGIAICMHEKDDDDSFVILPAAKTRKMHSSKRNAFKAINTEPLARIDLKKNKITFPRKESADKKMILKNKIEEKTALLKIHPNIDYEIIDYFKKSGLKGLILEGTGLGHTPGRDDDIAKGNKEFFDALEELIKSGCVVGMTTQCINGRVNMNVYRTGRFLQEIGVLSGEDMLPETAFVKLAWLLGNYTKDETVKLFSQNLRGEINQRLKIEEDEN